MLSELVIHNLVIVEHARLNPGEGLTVVSGETGAGKSLLLDALEMVSGERVQSRVVGPWAESATVTAVFQAGVVVCSRIETLCSVPAADGQYILRRRISGGGRSQAWINDVPVTAGALRLAADHLLEIHSQHEPLRLADPAVQLEMLDAYAGLGDKAAAYSATHERVLALTKVLSDLDGGARESVKELDYLTFQLREIEALQPRRGELVELQSRHALLSSASTWKELAEGAVQSLSEDERSVANVLARLARRLGEAPEPGLANAAVACQQALEAVRDAAASCGQAAERLSADPTELAKTEGRLNAYHELCRKHGDGETPLLAAWEQLSLRIQELSTVGERRAKTAADFSLAVGERKRLGLALAKARSTAFVKLAKAAHEHLGELSMPKARMSLDEELLAEPTSLGTHRQEFLVQTNPGMAAGKLRDVASGGECARIALALAEALAAQEHVPVMVFDEVDSGVGGRLGAVIGAKLARLAHGRTVLAVTHTPQLAAAARRQYLVSKQQGDRDTRVTVAEVSGDARLKEISEMLGGGKAALDQARALLGGAIGGMKR